MKINKILLGAFALSMTFASCSNDEPAKGSNEGGSEGEKYMAVTIRTVSNGSRTTELGDPEFEPAEDIEGTITKEKLYFLFFDDKGNAFPLAYANVNGTVTTNMVVPSELSSSSGDGIDNSVTGVLVLGKAVGAGYVGETPSQVLCVANPRTEVMKNLENKNLPSVLAQTTTAPTSWTTAGDFLMTNTTYVSGNKVVTAVDVTGKFANDPDEAKKSPVIIPIERLTAKVRARYNDSFVVKKRNQDGTIESPGKFMLDNNEVQFTVEINGWQLCNLAKQANAFKKLSATYDFDPKWTWNDETRQRSYWAESNQGATLNNAGFSFDDQFANKSFMSGTANVQYCYENTGFTNAEVTDRSSKATAIVVKATVKKDGQAVNMCRWAGTYYTYDRLVEKIVDAYNTDDTHVEKATAQNVTFVDNNTANDNTYHAVVTVNGVATTMSAFNEILWWKNGVTSYYLNIKHLGNLTGVVRNHIYDYTIDDVVGLGVPGNEPNTPEETETFLAAHVRVLNWHVISNNVTLE